MAVKLFVLGLPGSGKSSVARYISTHARDRRWSITHITDYDILYQMFQEDTQGQFEPADFGGFDIIDLSAFDVALKSLEQQVNENISTAKSTEIILIEFSRNDYQRAFQQFSHPSFLKDGYFLYLDANIGTCKRRIRERITHPTTSDDHFVSEYIFGAYYHGDNGRCLSNILEKDYMLDKQRVLVIDNNCSLEATSKKIAPFIDYIINSSSILKDKVDMSSSSLEGPVTNEVVNTSVNNPGQSISDDTSVSPKVLDENTSNLELVQI
jgi:adenylate kinase family enzyme